MMLSSQKFEEACFSRWFASIVAVIFMTGIWCAAYFQLEAFWTDVGTGWALGFVVAFICGGVLVLSTQNGNSIRKWKRFYRILPRTIYRQSSRNIRPFL